MTQKTEKKLGTLAILDWATSALALAVGIIMVAIEWPAPSIWAWVFLGLGVAGVPLALFNPIGKLQTWMFRRLVKRR